MKAARLKRSSSSPQARSHAHIDRVDADVRARQHRRREAPGAGDREGIAGQFVGAADRPGQGVAQRDVDADDNGCDQQHRAAGDRAHARYPFGDRLQALHQSSLLIGQSGRVVRIQDARASLGPAGRRRTSRNRRLQSEGLADGLVPLLRAFGAAALGPAGQHRAFDKLLVRFGLLGLHRHDASSSPACPWCRAACRYCSCRLRRSSS